MVINNKGSVGVNANRGGLVYERCVDAVESFYQTLFVNLTSLWSPWWSLLHSTRPSVPPLLRPPPIPPTRSSNNTPLADTDSSKPNCSFTKTVLFRLRSTSPVTEAVIGSDGVWVGSEVTVLTVRFTTKRNLQCSVSCFPPRPPVMSNTQWLKRLVPHQHQQQQQHQFLAIVLLRLLVQWLLYELDFMKLNGP